MGELHYELARVKLHVGLARWCLSGDNILPWPNPIPKQIIRILFFAPRPVAYPLATATGVLQEAPAVTVLPVYWLFLFWMCCGKIFLRV